MIQLVIFILYIKYELSILYSFEDIFDEKFGKKEKGHIQGRINRSMPVLSPMIQLVVVYLYTKYELSISSEDDILVNFTYKPRIPWDRTILNKFGKGPLDNTTYQYKYLSQEVLKKIFAYFFYVYLGLKPRNSWGRCI